MFTDSATSKFNPSGSYDHIRVQKMLLIYTCIVEPPENCDQNQSVAIVICLTVSRSVVDVLLLQKRKRSLV